MIDRTHFRRRLASATYQTSSPLENYFCKHEEIADQKIAVFGSVAVPSHDDVCRHVASKQLTGLPFFVMSLPRLVESIEEWRMRLPHVSPFYALRCNADPVLAQVLVDRANVGFEVADAEMLDQALNLVPPSRIMYSNPCLTRKALRYANDCDVGFITIESENDLLNVISYAPKASLLLRVCMSSHLHRVADSVEAQFGCSFEEATEMLLSARELCAKVVGISFNMGANCTDPSIFYKAIRVARQLVDIGRAYGHRMHTVCLGGGFSNIEKSLFVEASDVISSAIDNLLPPSMGVSVTATPGRFFAAPAFTLCTTVIAKHVVDICELTNDEFDEGSGFVYHTNEGVYGSFGCRLVAHCEPKCRPLETRPLHSKLFDATILGPNPKGDVAQPLARLPSLSVGEWLIWDNMGAYSMPSDSQDEGLPVYYFDSYKTSWKGQSKSRSRTSSTDEVISVVGSDGESAQCSESEDDVDDDDDQNLARCFRHIFHHY